MNVRFHRIPKDLRLLTKMAITFYENEFLPDKHLGYDLLVSFEEKFLGLGGTEQPDPFLFEIKIRSPISTVSQYLNTLFHELTHVKQMMEGRLRMEHLCVVFEGAKHYVSSYGTNPIEELCSPWEIEAYGYGEAVSLAFECKLASIDRDLASAVFEDFTETANRQKMQWGKINGASRLIGLHRLIT